MTSPPLPEIGEQVPGFSGRTQHGERIELQQLAGAPVLVMFYPFAFSRVCDSELHVLMQRSAEIRASGASVLAISCDSLHSLRAYAQTLLAELPVEESSELPFELVSDFWPHGAIAARYGAFDAERGAARRMSFLLDPSLRLAQVQSVPTSQSRDLDAAIQVLRRLR